MEPGAASLCAAPDVDAGGEVEGGELGANAVFPDGLVGHVAGGKADLEVVLENVFGHASAVICDDDAVNMFLAAVVAAFVEVDPNTVGAGLQAVVGRLAERGGQVEACVAKRSEGPAGE